ncbi:hypothetical protein OBBRIDRAFT_211729 [Obba rivulosa]|uniref:Uncharacterized protein n=1 Tax=Obba rivulosa TaxID=1052685 RepID=A0A8E2DH61_9APHY|nr:hypothetical protein OBBRIDRAFT_211729 [Obba rivulosa]
METHLAILHYRKGPTGYVHYRDATYICRFRYPQYTHTIKTWDFSIARLFIHSDGLGDPKCAAPFIHSRDDTIIHINFIAERGGLPTGISHIFSSNSSLRHPAVHQRCR